MQPSQDSFVVVLHSRKSMQQCPSNTSSNFTNILPKNLHLDGYDVALVQLSYHDNLRMIKPYTPITKSGQGYFDTYYNVDNKVSVFSLKGNKMNVTKSYEMFGDFVTGLNQSFQAASISATVVAEYAYGGIAKSITLTYSNSDGYELHIGSRLAKIFGLAKSSFQPGSYESDLELEPSDFVRLPLTEEFEISLQKWITETVELEQLQDPTLEDIGWAIVAALKTINHTIQFFVDQDNNTLTINTRDSNKFLKFSTRLEERLGLPKDQRVGGKVVVNVTPEQIDPFKPYSRDYLMSTDETGFFSSQKMLVLCSLLDSNYYEQETLPVLALASRKEGDQEFSFVPQYPIYLPVGVNDTTNINIQLVGDDLKPIPETELATVAVLHFKKRWVA